MAGVRVTTTEWVPVGGLIRYQVSNEVAFVASASLRILIKAVPLKVMVLTEEVAFAMEIWTSRRFSAPVVGTVALKVAVATVPV